MLANVPKLHATMNANQPRNYFKPFKRTSRYVKILSKAKFVVMATIVPSVWLGKKENLKNLKGNVTVAK
jgi:hypothetical protein